MVEAGEPWPDFRSVGCLGHGSVGPKVGMGLCPFCHQESPVDVDGHGYHIAGVVMPPGKKELVVKMEAWPFRLCS